MSSQDNLVVVDWHDAVIWGVMKMSNSPIGGASESACPSESVDEVELCVRTCIGFPLKLVLAVPLDKRLLRRPPLEICLEFLQGE